MIRPHPHSVAEFASKKAYRRPRRAGPVSKYLMKLHDKMHEDMYKFQQNLNRIIFDSATGYLLEYVPTRNIIRIAESMYRIKSTHLTGYDYAEANEKRKILGEKIDSVNSILDQHAVIGRHLVPYIVFSNDTDAHQMLSQHINRLIMAAHEYALSTYVKGGRYCGCSIMGDAEGVEDDYISALCQGASDAEFHGGGRVDVQTGAHRESVEVSGGSSRTRHVLLRHVETGGNECTRGRLLGLKFGIETLFKTRCTTDSDEVLWMKCRFDVHKPSELRTLGLYLSDWNVEDVASERRCRQHLRRGMTLAHATHVAGQRNECHPNYLFYGVSDEGTRRASVHFGIRDPGLIKGVLGSEGETSFVSSDKFERILEIE